MSRSAQVAVLGHRLLQLGVALFLIGLVTGFAVPFLANPCMGLTSHLEGVLNGIFLILLGLLWPRLALTERAFRATFWLALYGTFANWATTLLAAAWGAGGTTMPIAAPGLEGSPFQENMIAAMLLSLSVAVIAASALVLYGLRMVPAPAATVDVSTASFVTPGQRSPDASPGARVAPGP
jgi:(hydroxyamino)benzene mutase